MTTKENWNITTETVPNAKDNEFVVKVQTISLDPAMRGWMNDRKSYIPPVGIGEVMRAIGIGKIVSSNNDKYKIGDYVSGMFGVQQYSTIAPSDLKKKSIAKVNVSSFAPESVWLNTLGMPGMTAYFGLKEVGLPVAGETIVVSAAAGAVGQTVGQLAKILGLRVVGIAGGKDKCDWVVKSLGYDACIDYKASASAVREGLKAHCPAGVDIYFDNVGGEILDTVLTRLNRRARVVICGAISQYNATGAVEGPKNYYSLLVNR